jgi:hypothetical protein
MDFQSSATDPNPPALVYCCLAPHTFIVLGLTQNCPKMAHMKKASNRASASLDAFCSYLIAEWTINPIRLYRMGYTP